MSEALERGGVGIGREGKANLDTEKHKSQLSWGKNWGNLIFRLVRQFMTGSNMSQSVNIKLVYTSLVGFIMGYI